MTAVFYAAGAVLVAAGLCIGAIWVYGLGKQSAMAENAELAIELAEAHEELTETDRALAALRASVEQHRGQGTPRTLAGRPAVLTPELADALDRQAKRLAGQSDAARDEAAHKRLMDRGDE